MAQRADCHRPDTDNLDSLTRDLLTARDEYGSEAAREAYDRVIRRFQDAIYAYCLRILKEPNEAQELAQCVAIQSWENIQGLKDVRAYAGWLRTIIRHMCGNALAKVRHEQQMPANEYGEWDVPDHHVAEYVDDDEEEKESRERRDILQICMGAMKPLDRETLEAHYFGAKSLKDMSAELKVPTGTIKRRLHVARTRLLHVVAGSGFVPEMAL